MRELGTERREVAGNALRRNGACCFDGDVKTALVEFAREVVDAFGDHWFAASEHDVAHGRFVHEAEDFRDAHFRAGRVPRGVRSIAP